MQRGKTFKLPDAINCGNENEYTQIPNDFLRDPKISAKAKTILCILLSNREGWHSYVETIQTMMKEGRDFIKSGIAELEDYGYVLRIRYRDKTTSKWAGSFWAYTNEPFKFQISANLRLLKAQGFSVDTHKIKGLKPRTALPPLVNPSTALPPLVNPRLRILKKKKTNNKNTKTNFIELFSDDWKDNEEFQITVRDYEIHRKEKGNKMTSIAEDRLHTKLIKGTLQEAIDAIEYSLDKGWVGVFPEKMNGHAGSDKKGPRHRDKKRTYKEAENEV